jgi:hypothetical protein
LIQSPRNGTTPSRSTDAAADTPQILAGGEKTRLRFYFQ